MIVTPHYCSRAVDVRRVCRRPVPPRGQAQVILHPLLPLLLPPPSWFALHAAMAISESRRVAARVVGQLSTLVGRRRLGSSDQKHLERAIFHLSALSVGGSRVSWHLHASGNSTDCEVFLVPVIEAPRLLRGPAVRVLAMAYLFLHSRHAMIEGARMQLQVRPALFPGASLLNEANHLMSGGDSASGGSGDDPVPGGESSGEDGSDVDERIEDVLHSMDPNLNAFHSPTSAVPRPVHVPSAVAVGLVSSLLAGAKNLVELFNSITTQAKKRGEARPLYPSCAQSAALVATPVLR